MMEKIEQIMARLDQLYRSVPLESSGYVMSAIQDIEQIVYQDQETAYSEEYDAFYYTATGEWIEPKCSDPNCEFCTKRPPRFPIEKVK
jgi:hypothetical protein